MNEKESQAFSESVDAFITMPSGAREGVITRRAKHLARKYGVQETRNFILTLLNLYLLENPGCDKTKYLKQRFDPSTGLIKSRTGSVLGFLNFDIEVIAQRLPLTMKVVSGLHKELSFKRGLLEQVEVFYPGAVHVNFYGFNKDRELWISRNFHEAVEIPYYHEPDDQDPDRYLEVKHDNLESGFAKACKWWKGCRDWYRLHDSKYYVVESQGEQLLIF